MKRVIIIFLMIVFIMVVTGFDIFAQGGNENSDSYFYGTEHLSFEPTTKVSFDPNTDIITFFESRGISAENLNVDPNQLNASIIDDIDEVIDDNYEDLIEDMVQPQLKAEVSRGNIEYAYMILGSRLYSVSIDSFAN